MTRTLRTRGSVGGFVTALALAGTALVGTPAQAAPTPAPTPAKPATTAPSSTTPIDTSQARPPATRRAAPGPGTANVTVAGTLNGLRTGLPFVGQPSFDAKVQDYALKCTKGSQKVSVTFSGSNLAIDGARGATLTRDYTLVENQALVVSANNTQYWLRCLPRDFPDLKVQRNGDVPNGWYVLETNEPWVYPEYDNGDLSYAMITDTNGTPVWYTGMANGFMNSQPVDPTILTWLPRVAGVGWMPDLRYIRYDLTSQQVTEFGPTVKNVHLDPHEMLLQTNGRWGWMSTPPVKVGDLAGAGFPGVPAGTDEIYDCRIQEVDEAGNVFWEWRAYANVNPAHEAIGLESNKSNPNAAVMLMGKWDAYHCNSLDRDANGDYLVSMRSTSSVFKVYGPDAAKRGKKPGTIAYEIRGAGSYGDVPANGLGGRTNTWPILTVKNADGSNAANPFTGQHDARFTPRGISLFNNNYPGWGRRSATMEFQVDEAAKTATIVWNRPVDPTFQSTHMGSFQRRESTGENVVGYGAIPGGGLAEMDNNGVIKRRITPGQEGGYRARKYAPDAFQAWTLRDAAGRPIIACNAPILDREDELGTAHGKRTSGLLTGLAQDGCARTYADVTILWSQQTGAKVAKGAIREAYVGLGSEGGRMGYPLGDEFCGLRDGGCGQAFQGGMIYWSPNSGSHAVWGAIGEKYADQKWETGPLGYPTGDEECWIEGGCFQRFTGGMVYWSPAGGAHPVWGAIGGEWGRLGWERNLGFPVSDEMCGLRDGGCWQNFDRGAILWSPRSGAHENRGLIRDEFGRQGWERSRLGYPTTGERCGQADGGCIQEFQGGRITWSPPRGVFTTFR